MSDQGDFPPPGDDDQFGAGGAPGGDDDQFGAGMGAPGGGDDDDQQGGAGDDAEPAAPAPAQHIQLRVRNVSGGEVQFKIKKSSTLKKLMDSYCARVGELICCRSRCCNDFLVIFGRF